MYIDTNELFDEIYLVLQSFKARTPIRHLMPDRVVEQSRLKFKHLMDNINRQPIAPGHPDFFHGLIFHSSPQEDMQTLHSSFSALEQVITTQVLSQE